MILFKSLEFSLHGFNPSSVFDGLFVSSRFSDCVNRIDKVLHFRRKMRVSNEIIYVMLGRVG